MLTLTTNAAEAVKTIVSSVPVAEDGGVRIRDTGGERGFELSVAPTPAPDDTVVESEGARVFLDATTVDALDHRVLDASVEPDGSVRFALAMQA